jgi:hypothetical protein
MRARLTTEHKLYRHTAMVRSSTNRVEWSTTTACNIETSLSPKAAPDPISDLSSAPRRQDYLHKARVIKPSPGSINSHCSSR